MAVWPSEVAHDPACGTGAVEFGQPSDNGEDISVALEWKLLFPLLAAGHEDPRPEDGRRIVGASSVDNKQACLEQGHDCVAEVIREVGENAVTAHSLVRDNIDERELWGSGWVVKKANSAEPMDAEKVIKGYVWVPVEICSPKMRLKDPETGARMRKVLDNLSSTYRLAANCSCEVHIHLGQMDGQALALPALKRLGTLLWVAEPTLRSIRDPKSPNAANTYTWGFAMREYSRLAEKILDSAAAPRELGTVLDQQIFDSMAGRTAAPAKELSAVAEIWKTTSHLELGQLLSGPDKKHRRLGFNFSAFGEEDERAKRNPRTMEFRMMEGSVEAELVMGWMAICGTIAEVAVAESDARYAAAIDLLLRRLGGEGGGLSETVGNQRGREFRELMLALGISEGIYQAFEKKIRWEHSYEV
ncbi:hypothetical protein N0V88_006567 [Collariella sp. IMI 366227]|nr:hypothetical protein N0V88_006567 [Collariella sp. IMI 366227]